MTSTTLLRSTRLLFVLCIGISGCDLSTGSGATPRELRFEAPEVVLKPGEEAAVKLAAVDQHGEPLVDQSWASTVLWSSADTSIARVSGGVVSAVGKAGATEISAALDDLVSSVAVRVVPGAPISITLASDTVDLSDPAESIVLSLTALDAWGNTVDDLAVEWSSSDTTVATVSAVGLLTQNGPGQTTIIAAHGELRATSIVRIRRAEITSSIPADTVISSLTLRLSADVVSREAISRVTYSVDGSPEVPMELGSQPSAGVYRFSAPARTHERLNGLQPGSHRVLLRAYTADGRLQGQEESAFRVEIPVVRYSVWFLGNMGGVDSSGRELNEKNQVVGSVTDADGTSRAAYWDGIGGVDLGPVLGSGSRALSVNESGEVVAISEAGCPGLQRRSFYWRAREGAPSPLLSSCRSGSGVASINDAGKILLNDGGQLVLRTSSGSTPFPGGDLFPTGVVLNNRDEALAVNASAGVESVVLRMGATPLRILSSRYCWVTDVNHFGDVTFECTFTSTVGGYRLASMSSNVTFSDVSEFIWPKAINNNRRIAGTVANGGDGPPTPLWRSAFIWQSGIISLVETGVWRIDGVSDINDAGVILAHGVNAETGIKGAVLLTPVE